MHDHSKLEPLFYNPEIDTSRTAEYLRFRSITKEIAANPKGIKMGNSEVLGPLMYFIDYYARYNLFAEFFPLPPEPGETGGKWRKFGESLVGSEPLASKQKAEIVPARFFSTVQSLVTSPDDEVAAKISSIRENLKMDPTALFAAQYAEAVKLERASIRSSSTTKH